MSDAHAEASARLRARLRLIPLVSAMPMLSAAAAAARPRHAGDHRRDADGLVQLCAQVLRGRHPLTAVRRVADAAAFGQFSALYRRLRGPEAATVSMRLCHSDIAPGGALDMVATLRAGDRVRAVALRAEGHSRHGWQLTLCQLIERY